MPSSMIFAGLVVIWLLILVPAVARHRQEVARPSEAALAGRVLARPRRTETEVDGMNESTDSATDDGSKPPSRTMTAEQDTPAVPAARPAAPQERITAADEPADLADDQRDWARPSASFRPGRGGYDPEAAALAARARATFRQRIVIALLLAAVATAVIAVVSSPLLWWPHIAIDLTLVGYLVYLRRQVRMEESIRDRRAARMAGTRRRQAAEDPELDEWAARGREATRVADRPAPVEAPTAAPVDTEDDTDEAADDLLREQPKRVTGTGVPLPRIVTPLDELTVESALPRLEHAPPPPLPAGTVLVEAEDDDPEAHALDEAPRTDYRRAAGA